MGEGGDFTKSQVLGRHEKSPENRIFSRRMAWKHQRKTATNLGDSLTIPVGLWTTPLCRILVPSVKDSKMHQGVLA